MGDLQHDLVWPLFYQRQIISNISSQGSCMPRGAAAAVDAGYAYTMGWPRANGQPAAGADASVMSWGTLPPCSLEGWQWAAFIPSTSFTARLSGTQTSVAVFVVAVEIKGDEGAGYLTVQPGSPAGHANSIWMHWKKNTFPLSALTLLHILKSTYHLVGSGLSRAVCACLRMGTLFRNKQDNASRLSVGLSQPKDSLTFSKSVYGSTFHHKWGIFAHTKCSQGLK